MNNKQQIEEMAKVIDSDCYACKNCDILKRYKKQDGFNGISCSSIKKAEDCYKIATLKDSVVLTREEYDYITFANKFIKEEMQSIKEQTRKETAAKIWRKVINLLKIFEVDKIYLLESIYDLAKKDGVEIKEN